MTYCGDIELDFVPKRKGKESPNELRKRIMELREENDMLRAELYEARKKLQGTCASPLAKGAKSL